LFRSAGRLVKSRQRGPPAAISAGVETRGGSRDHALVRGASEEIEMVESSTKIERDLMGDVDAIRADIDVLRKDLATVLDRIKGTATSRADSEIQALQKRISRIADDVQSSGRDGLRAVEEHIEERPLVSLAMAFAVGLVLGRLFDRR
jgi:ElaB/YqjD/DUF883 family membrane-anchored ribosome-binding protein